MGKRGPKPADGTGKQSKIQATLSQSEMAYVEAIAKSRGLSRAKVLGEAVKLLSEGEELGLLKKFTGTDSPSCAAA